MTTMLLDPTAETSAATRPRLKRPLDLTGLTVGLMDISKPRGDIFLNRIEALLKDRNIQVKRFMKPTFTRVAPTELKQEIAGEVDLVVEGLADWGSCTSCCIHDLTDLESRGIPGVGVASSAFIKAADVQKEALGSATDMIFVPHPIQDRTDEEMMALADQAIEKIIERLTT